MQEERFKVRVTVGGIVEKEGKILVVRQPIHPEKTGPKITITQPAGHVEENETLEQALLREVKEESGYTVRPTALIGVYFRPWQNSPSLRFSYVCELTDDLVVPLTDINILEALWMPIEEVKTRRSEYRSGSTEITFDDYFAGKRYPLELIKCFEKIRS
ncbi:MAG: NUDIX hydrolase [Candidatus Uhrbacteria bacterium GW2011_GWE2_40_58]|nr:MAG: NUDIX hydrolase [Candidatus Uhrbacteria bacterium GW2011_GWF2_40_263]KKR68044.1 MAG: NUDIX hydrolase [Candidatus Uhrbacteria bacterium GW2011_GWE2_40_58]HBK34633.1 NUDIX hydrolase [Candidatus Uhrbacteria bacterium]HCB55800.1 NUDIX hydrolase [Candidatus Uhrbacteria bacterium]